MTEGSSIGYICVSNAIVMTPSDEMPKTYGTGLSAFSCLLRYSSFTTSMLSWSLSDCKEIEPI